jgi:hypothetical protein
MDGDVRLARARRTVLQDAARVFDEELRQLPVGFVLRHIIFDYLSLSIVGF